MKINLGFPYYSISMFKLHKNKSPNIVKRLKQKVTRFSRHHIQIKHEPLCSGVYGTVFAAHLSSMKQNVAVMALSDKASQSDIFG